MTYLTASLAAGALAAGLYLGYSVAGYRYERQASERAQEAAAQAEVVALRGRAAARQYEAWKAAQRPRTITITREVTHVLRENPGWSDVPLPDGVRRALEAAASGIGAAEPESAVPPVPDPKSVKQL